jgi:hypothetical protein
MQDDIFIFNNANVLTYVVIWSFLFLPCVFSYPGLFPSGFPAVQPHNLLQAVYNK